MRLLASLSCRWYNCPPGPPISRLQHVLYESAALMMQEYGPEADLWSVGMLLYQLLTGSFPFWDSVQNLTLQQVGVLPLVLLPGSNAQMLLACRLMLPCMHWTVQLTPIGCTGASLFHCPAVTSSSSRSASSSPVQGVPHRCGRRSCRRRWTWTPGK